MCKSTTTITAKVEELMELRKLAEELQNQMDVILFIEIPSFPGAMRLCDLSAGPEELLILSVPIARRSKNTTKKAVLFKDGFPRRDGFKGCEWA